MTPAPPPPENGGVAAVTPAAALDVAAIRAQFDAMHTSSADCESARYLGSLTGADGARQYIYVFDLIVVGQRSSVWFVFTTLSDRVVNIE